MRRQPHRLVQDSLVMSHLFAYWTDGGMESVIEEEKTEWKRQKKKKVGQEEDKECSDVVLQLQTQPENSALQS